MTYPLKAMDGLEDVVSLASYWGQFGGQNFQGAFAVKLPGRVLLHFVI